MNAGANTKSVLKYSLLPGIFPRFNALFGTGFSYFAYLMAQIYNIPGLLPNTHPYLNARNIGRFGIRHVVAAAAQNLEFKREKADQIALFFMMIIGLGLLVLQLIGLAFALISPDAFAGPLDTYFGVNPASDRSQDIAFILMDRVFGVPGIFESCVTTADQCYRLTPEFDYDTSSPMTLPQAPWPFHLALHQLFRFYNMGLLVIAMFIILYYVIVVTAETAQTGTPFGKRFNSVWAPIRLVVAIGLLVPLSSGLSSAQYIVLYAAKLGSNMATNGWIVFNQEIARAQANMLGSGENVGTPNAPDLRELVTFVTLAKACQKIEDEYMSAPQLVNDNGDGTSCVSNPGKRPVKPYLVGSPRSTPNYREFTSTPYSEALEFYNNGDILVRFGYRNQCRHANKSGYVNGVCGDLIFPTKALTEPGATTVQTGYFELVKEMWSDDRIANIANYYVGVYASDIADGGAGSGAYPEEPPKLEELNDIIVSYMGGTEGNEANANLRYIIDAGVEAASNPANWDIPAQLLQRGWGGAGIWYNRIAQINGALVGASRALPDPSHYPLVMEEVALLNRQTQESVTGESLYNPSLVYASGENRQAGDVEAGRAYYHLHNDLSTGLNSLGEEVQSITGNPLTDAINFLLGTEGLFNMTKPENKDVHPLAQLAALGKGLVESAVFMLGAGTLGGVVCMGGSDLGCSGMGLAYGIAGLGLTVGFVLFYVVPFLPFVYFFFAVGGWVKGIFEAMVGAPLWALGHLRIDGNGLPGEGAMNGYYLIFEVFIRPLLIVFGFLAGVLIFGAMAAVLNEIWGTVVENVSGNSADDTVEREGLDYYLDIARGAVDQLFFTILYAIIMYMMALSSFKLIDLIPNNILRWMGSSASSFGDTQQNVAESLTQYAAIGGGMVFQQGLGGIQGGFQGARSAQQAKANLEQQQATQAAIERATGGGGGQTGG